MRVAVLPGDGIGPEVIDAAEEALRVLAPDLEIVHGELGLDCYSRLGEYLPDETMTLLKESQAALFGAITSPIVANDYQSPILTIRKKMDLYANLRPVRNPAPGIGLKDIDVVIVRENTEGMYTGEETVYKEHIELARRVSRYACERICAFARNTGESMGRKKVSCVHKANVLRKSDGLFRDVFYTSMAGSTLSAEDALVDAVAAGLVTSPQFYDVIVTLNLYGDILSDEAAALAGGLGIAPSANLNERFGLFEPVHGSAPDIAGKGIANPTAAFLSTAMMLEFLGMKAEGTKLRSAVEEVLASGNRTRDLGGSLSTKEFGRLVVKRCLTI